MKTAYTSPEGLQDQFAFLDSLRVTYYRIDVQSDTLRDDLTYYGAPLTTILDMADRHGVKILPVLTNLPDTTTRPGTKSIEVNRRAGYRIGNILAARYGNRLTHIEAGNELDHLSIHAGVDGSELQHYDSAYLSRTTAFLQGMAQGIRAAAPNVRIIISTAGWRHYGFLHAMKRDSVDYDVVGYHWYSELGDIDAPITGGRSVLDHLAAIGKDIWITEINRSNGSFREAAPYDQAYWITKYVRDYYRFEAVKAFFVYELYDENEFIDLPDTTYTEAYYGLVSCPEGQVTCLGPKRPKAAFNAYRFAIEEQVHGYEDYTYGLFTHVARRPPTSSELSTWTKRFVTLGQQSSSGKSTFAMMFLRENAPIVIRDVYQHLLDHVPASEAVTFWTDQIARGRSVRDLTLQLCASNEFWMLSGASEEGFIGRTYRLLLGREPDAIERAAVLARFAAGMSREDAIESVLDSPEYHAVLVDSQYQRIVGRAPEPSERARDIERMQHGLTQEELIVDLLGTAEYWNGVIRDGYWRRMQNAAHP